MVMLRISAGMCHNMVNFVVNMCYAFLSLRRKEGGFTNTVKPDQLQAGESLIFEPFKEAVFGGPCSKNSSKYRLLKLIFVLF